MVINWVNNDIRDTTEGFFSRWVVVPFSGFFPAGVANTGLIDVLTRPRVLQGLLRGAVGGLQQVMRRGHFSLPPSVVNATARFKAESNPIHGFIEERALFQHEQSPVFTPRADIYGAYVAWSVVNGFQQMSAQRFYESFTAAATEVSQYPLRAVIRDGIRGYAGVAIE